MQTSLITSKKPKARTSTIWSQPSCSYCTKAKQLLSSAGVVYIENILGSGFNKADLLAVAPKATTVPQIFIDGVYIGGYQDLVNFFEGVYG